jgi:mRNA interferase MazF
VNTKELSKVVNNIKGNLTTTQFADKINIPAIYLTDIIKGKIREYPSKNILRRIANGSEDVFSQLLNICEYNESKYNNIQEIKRMQIYMADLGEGFGSEQGGIRPVIILQNDIGNKFAPTVLIAPITSKLYKSDMPTHIILDPTCGLEKVSMVLIEQQRTVDKKRLLECVATVCNLNDITLIEKAMKIQGGIKTELNDQRATQLVKSLIIANRLSKESKEVNYMKNVLMQEFKEYCDLCNLDYKDIYSEYRTKIVSRSYNNDSNSVSNVEYIPAYAM